jgi:mannosyl-3-phosphoglycerate phosphatase
MNSHLLIFTDLDGTLLDQVTYSFKAALPALHALSQKNIPLIICTSKTRAEIEWFRSKLDNIHPFISENGGAIFVPHKYFAFDFPFTRKDSEYAVIELGTPYQSLREAFAKIKTHFPSILKGFGDLSTQEVADLCGLSYSQALLAQKREYDEPFILEDESAEEKVRMMVQALNLKISRGGRFYHLMGRNDKGKAALLLRDIYAQVNSRVKTAGLGDSLNDLPLLEVVDFPILVQKPGGVYDPSIQLENLIPAQGEGPKGWNDVVLKLIAEII